jgi:hypothetical protein
MSGIGIFRQRPSTGPIVSGIPRLSDMAYFKEPSGVELSLSSYISSALYGIPEPMAIWQHRLIHLPEDVLLHQCAGLNQGCNQFSRKGTLPLEIVRPCRILGAREPASTGR